MVNIIGDFRLIDSVQDFGTQPELDGAFDVVTATINGTVYAYVSGNRDSGIQVFEVATDGTLEPVTSIETYGSAGIYYPEFMRTMVINGETFLAVTSPYSNAISMYRVDDDDDGTDGHLIFVETLQDSELFGDTRQIETLRVGGNTFLVIADYDNDAVSVIRVGNNGRMTVVDTITDADTDDLRLDGSWSVATHETNQGSFVIVGDYSGDNGLTVFEVNGNGQLEMVQSFTAEGGYNRFVSMDVIESHGASYLLAVDDYNSDIHVLRIANNGELTEVSVFDSPYSDVRGLETFEVDGVQFILATSNTDRLMVLTLNEDGEVQIVQEIVDAQFLDNSTEVSVQQFGSRTFVLVTAYDSDRLSVYEIGASDDPVTGTMEADSIVGMDGDDDLLGLGGNDFLSGGNGDDVLSGRAGNDTLEGGNGVDALVGGNGNDTLEGGAGGDLLNGGGGIDTLSYAGSNAAVTINLAAGTASGGHATGDLFVGFENVMGSRFNDTITGDADNNMLRGGNGNDALSGGGGNDRLIGQRGNDTLDGGDGRDRLVGGGGNDRLDGGGGNDRLLGGGARDIMEGGAGNDFLNGGGGNDVIDGGAGNDIMIGGRGADTFVFTGDFGDDTIRNFELNGDVLDFSAISEINSIQDFRDAAVTIAGNTVVLIDGGASSITIEGFTENQFSADNFDFT